MSSFLQICSSFVHGNRVAIKLHDHRQYIATNLSWLDYEYRGCRVVSMPTYLRFNCILSGIMIV